MSWYIKIESIKPIRLASMNLIVNGYQYPENLDTIIDLCYYLGTPVRNKIIEEVGEDGFQEFLDKNGFEFIAPDGTDVFEETGTINFYVSGLSQDLLLKLIFFIMDEFFE